MIWTSQILRYPCRLVASSGSLPFRVNYGLRSQPIDLRAEKVEVRRGRAKLGAINSTVKLAAQIAPGGGHPNMIFYPEEAWPGRPGWGWAWTSRKPTVAGCPSKQVGARPGWAPRLVLPQLSVQTGTGWLPLLPQIQLWFCGKVTATGGTGRELRL